MNISTSLSAVQRRVPLFAALLLAFSLLSCDPEAGEGGLATITGRVFAEEYNSSGILVNSYYIPEERVYIIYGDHLIYDDDTRTHFDGSYQFKFLNKGRYQVFAYSECLTCPSLTEPVIVEVEITDRKQQVELPDIVIRK